MKRQAACRSVVQVAPSQTQFAGHEYHTPTTPTPSPLYPCILWCRSPTCCAETDCLHNPLDPDYANAISCPCIISQSSRCVAPGTTLILECDPGGVCQDHCDWKTPGGTCHWDENSSTCTDSSIRFLNKNGACNIELTSLSLQTTALLVLAPPG